MTPHEKQTAALAAEVASQRARIEALEAAVQALTEKRAKAEPKTAEPKAP